MFARAFAATLLLASAAPSPPEPPRDQGAQARWPQQCQDGDDWDKPGPSFRVFGNTYYVGTCGISAILIGGGHSFVLIDGGPANAAGLIAKNIERLGFKVTDVKILLHSHEHNDHVGGLAELVRLTGGNLLASQAAASVLASGEPSRDDPQFALHNTFPPAKVTGVVADGEDVAITDGDIPISLTAVATPGHTPGALSWRWRSCEGSDCREIVYADSLTPVSSDSYRFSDHPEYLADFRASLARVAALKCDILLTPHPSASGMRDRLLKGSLTYPQGCKAYAAKLSKQLDERLAKEADGR